MKKIITFTVIACMITGCGALKRDEVAKTVIPDNTAESSTESPKSKQNQEEGQNKDQEQQGDQGQNQKEDPKQGKQEKEEGFFNNSIGSSLIIVIAIIGVIYIYKKYCNKKAPAAPVPPVPLREGEAAPA